MKHSPNPGQEYSFRATLENWAEGMDYCAIPVPTEITNALGTKGPVLVMAQVNDSKPFQVSLFPVGGGQHYIRIKAAIRRATSTKVGDLIQVRIIVLDREDVSIPQDLKIALRVERVTEAFNSLPAGKKNFMIRRVNEAVKPETRKKRIQEILETARQRRT